MSKWISSKYEEALEVIVWYNNFFCLVKLQISQTTLLSWWILEYNWDILVNLSWYKWPNLNGQITCIGIVHTLLMLNGEVWRVFVLVWIGGPIG